MNSRNFSFIQCIWFSGIDGGADLNKIGDGYMQNCLFPLLWTQTIHARNCILGSFFATVVIQYGLKVLLLPVSISVVLKGS